MNGTCIAIEYHHSLNTLATCIVHLMGIHFTTFVIRENCIIKYFKSLSVC